VPPLAAALPPARGSARTAPACARSVRERSTCCPRTRRRRCAPPHVAERLRLVAALRAPASQPRRMPDLGLSPVPGEDPDPPSSRSDSAPSRSDSDSTPTRLATAEFARTWTPTMPGGDPPDPRRRGATPPVAGRLRLVAERLRLDSDPPRSRLVRQTLDSHGCRGETPRTPRRRGATPPGRPAVGPSD
jgi:hypothetical protein